MATVNSNDPARLLDTSQPFDRDKVALLDEVVRVMYCGSGQDREMAHTVLSELKARPEAWVLVHEIFKFSTEANTKFFALAILESCIKSRWNILSDDQRNSIKMCVTQMAVDSARDPSTEKYLSQKVNETLVQIVKQDWPQSWPNFIPEMCNAARTDQSLCENVMRILCILSEEVFEFGEDFMTSKRVHNLRVSMTSEFQQIYELCTFILQNYVANPANISHALVATTLKCLAHFLKWVPYGFIFQTDLIDTLVDKLWLTAAFKVDCLTCLTEISNLQDVTKTGGSEELRAVQIQKLKGIWTKLVPRLTALPEQTLNYEESVPQNARYFWETFYQQLSLWLTVTLKNHRVAVCEDLASQPDPAGLQMLTFALTLLLKMTRIPHDATFKICLDFWHDFTETLVAELQLKYRAAQTGRTEPLQPGKATEIFMDLASQRRAAAGGGASATASDGIPFGSGGVAEINSSFEVVEPIEDAHLYCRRIELYHGILDELRRVMIRRMAKPQEVYINYDEETGTVDRDYQPDTDEIAMYNRMRECHIYLTNLGGKNTQAIMEAVLEEQLAERKSPEASDQWNPTQLSRLCWSIGAISGAMSANREKTFLLKVIRELLTLCEAIRGKSNKAIVASQVMYIIGQYPRFLNIRWRLLSILIDKLFFFMKDSFPGVQDMACETFLKVCQKCQHRIADPPTGDGGQPATEGDVPYLQTVIQNVHVKQQELETNKQRLMLYEAVSHCIVAADPQLRVQYIEKLLATYNACWAEIVSAAATDASNLLNVEVAKKVSEILRVNERVASATGSLFSAQFRQIYDQMLRIYTVYSTSISSEVERSGPQVMRFAQVKHFRLVKRETLRLVETFVDKAAQEGPEIRIEIAMHCLPPLLRPVLEDYRSNVPDARDFEVLMMLSTFIRRLDPEQIQRDMTIIFDCIFDSTLEMIKSDFSSHADIRANFYDFLQVCTSYCFKSFFTFDEARLTTLVDVFIWAFKHDDPTIAMKGLTTTFTFLKNLVEANSPEFISAFFRGFYYKLLNEVLRVLTDTLHKAGFKKQTLILQQLICVIDSGVVNSPEAELTKDAVSSKLVVSLVRDFPNLNGKQVETLVLEMFNNCDNSQKFQLLMRDFLVQLKEFAGADELFQLEQDEAALRAKQREESRRLMVPGMQPQWEGGRALLEFRDDED